MLPTSIGHFDNSAAAWERRIQSGQAGALMMQSIGDLEPGLALTNFGDWTDRIAKGELPFAKPPRPTGVERNIVLTLWDWSTPTSYMHDEVSTDRHNPTLNPKGIIYGSPELSSDYVAWLNPTTHEVGLIKTEWRDAKTPTTKAAPIYAASPYWGTEPVWDSHSLNHNPMMDEKGRVWLTSRIRPDANPAFCKTGSKHPSAAFPMNNSRRQLQMYDPATKKIETLDTCYTTHHLNFDRDGKIWFSSGSPNDPVVGWFDTKKWDETHDEQASQGWAPFIIDVNGDGKAGPYVEPNQPVDPAKDKRVLQGLYSVSANPADGTIWSVVLGFPGTATRFDPKTKLTEMYEVPWNDPKNPDFGLQPAGRRHHDGRRAVGGARERTLRELRPSSLQGPADGTDRGDRQGVSGGLEALHDPRPAIPWRRHEGRQRRSAVLRLGRSARHAGSRQERAASRPAICRMRCSRSSTANG